MKTNEVINQNERRCNKMSKLNNAVQSSRSASMTAMN